MSIELIGPEKFTFQDEVSVSLALEFIETASALIIEPTNGEDAELIFESGTSRNVVEVQVKGAAKTVTLASLARFLTHFPPRRTDGCLFDRVICDPHRSILFVVSARCADDAMSFVVNTREKPIRHREGKVRRKDAEALLAEFKRVNANRGKRLYETRRRECLKLAKKISKIAARRAAERILIRERVTSADIRSHCCAKLHDKHKVPADRLDDVLGRLRADVEHAKQNRTDVLPLVRETLRNFTRPAVRPTDYVSRGCESEWIATASRERVLLLTGPPRCGKSYAARWITGHFQNLGFEVRQGLNTDEAYRFLSEPGSVERVYLLDDPLGGVRIDAEASHSLVAIRSLVASLAPNRRLIISQNRDQLFAVMGVHELGGCEIGSYKWFDLGQPHKDFLVAAWLNMARRSAVSGQVTGAVRDLISSGKNGLEVGNLRHLASTADQLHSDPSVLEITRKAQEDAADLGRELVRSGTGTQQLLIALAIASQPDIPLPVKELAFVTFSAAQRLPGKIKSSDYTFTVLNGKRIAPRYPQYEKEVCLTPEIRHALDLLEKRHFLQHGVDGLRFTHAFYRAAAESLLSPATTNTASEAIRVLNRALFSLGPLTSRAAARSLTWLLQQLRDWPEQLNLLFKAAIGGLRSIFPATRDLCFLFLVKNEEVLPVKHAERLADWINSAVTIDIHDLEWRDGEAWVPTGEISWMNHWEREKQWLRSAEVEGDVQLLASSGAALTPERAARAANYLRHNPDAMNLRVALRLFSFDEAAIRAEAARAWLSVNRRNDAELLARVFGDQHPRVALGIYDGLIEGWRAASSHRQRKLLVHLSNWAISPVVAAALLPRLSVFDRVEYTGENPPWVLFAELMPLVLSAIPVNTRFDDARFFNSVRCCLPHATPQAIAKICTVWIGWLEREVKRRLPSDYEFGVLDILIDGTRKNPDVRAGLVRRALRFNGTAALVSFVRDLTPDWNKLLRDEKTALLELLGGNRVDSTWLQAVAITRAYVPAEIQELVLGRPDQLDDSADRLVAELSPDLLSCAVSVYAGTPQPLWWLGTQAADAPKLNGMFRVLENMPDHPLFEIALWRELISPEDDHVAEIVRKGGKRHAQRFFDYLLRYKVECTGNYLPTTWAVLLALMETTERDQCYEEMARCAPAILDDIFDASHWLKTIADRRAVLERLPYDLEPYRLMKQWEKDGDNPVRCDHKELASEFLKLAEEHKPRLYGTYSHMRKFLDRIGQNYPALSEAIEAARLAALAERDSIETRMKPGEPPLHHWVEP